MPNSKCFWNLTVNSNDAELRIDGDIVDDSWAWIYEWLGEASASPNKFRQELKKAEGKNLTVWIDSYGGDVIAAAGIYHALREHKGKKTVKIDGKAMSAASVIAMAGDTIEMYPMSILMIHNPWTGIQGEAKDMRHTADVLDTIKDTIINAYQSKTRRKRTDIACMMDAETWMDANKAVEEGFADKIMAMPKLESEEDPKAKAFMYSRLSFQNNAVKSLDKLFELAKAKLDTPKDSDPKTETHQDDSRPMSVNLYQSQILLNRRRNYV